MRGDPPILPTLSSLFGIVAAWQLIEIARADILSPTVDVAQSVEVDDASKIVTITEDGIEIVNDPHTEIEKARSDLRQERYALESLRVAVTTERHALEEARSGARVNQRAEYARLSEFYARMPSAKAAQILSELSADEAARFIALMPGGAGADILAAMNADRAVEIAREMLPERSTDPT